MAKKERVAALILGIFLFILAAVFSLGLILSVLDFTGKQNFFKTLGNILTGAYGISSILVPIFFFTAASFCLSARWSLSRAMILMVSIVPFFTMVTAEKMCRRIGATDTSPVAFAKIFTILVISILLVITEYLVAMIIAQQVNQHKISGKKFSLSQTSIHPRNFHTLLINKIPHKSHNKSESVSVTDEMDTDKGTTEQHIETVVEKETDTEAPESESKSVTTSGSDLDTDNVPLEETSVPEKKSRKYDDIWSVDDEGNIKGDSNVVVNTVDEEQSEPIETVAEEETVPEKEEVEAIPDYESNGKRLDDETEPSVEFAENNDFEDIIDQFESESINLQDDWTEAEKKNNSENDFNVEPIDYEMDFEENSYEDDSDEDTDSNSDEELSDEDELENSFREYEESVSLDEREEPDSFEFEEEDSDFNDDDDFAEPINEDQFDIAADEEDDYSEQLTQEEYNQTLQSVSASNPQNTKTNLTQTRSSSMNSALEDIFSKMESDAKKEIAASAPFEQAVQVQQAAATPDNNQSVPDESASPAQIQNVVGTTAMVTDANGNTAPLVLKPKKRNNFKGYRIDTDLLIAYDENPYWIIDDETKAAALNLKATLNEFRIEAEITNIVKGPVVTMFEMLPAPGIKLSKIVGLADNIALSLSASSVRIVAPIPGKRAVGIEIPNKKRAIVSFRECIEQQRPEWKKMAVPVVLGKDIQGESQLMDLVKTPHLLIAGSTGAGKSVCVNSMILSILYKRSPNEVKLILIDPKVVELKLYNGIPHLLTPVITEPKKAMQALQYALCEMERRYAVLDGMGCRDISSYNRKIVDQHIATEKLPYIVIIMDEFADLMATTGKQLESVVARLCAMSRAVGIHLVLATQRPSVDVITGLIKANIPSRVAFMVAAKTDSRIIIDQVGAEKLLGKGDMLYASATDPFPVRIQGTFVSDQEVEDVVNAVKEWGEPEYIDDEIFIDDEEAEDDGQLSLLGESGDDPLYEKALDIVVQAGKASASYIQRRLSIGYNRAARLVELMEERGIVGPANGSKPREIIRMP